MMSGLTARTVRSGADQLLQGQQARECGSERQGRGQHDRADHAQALNGA